MEKTSCKNIKELLKSSSFVLKFLPKQQWVQFFFIIVVGFIIGFKNKLSKFCL